MFSVEKSSGWFGIRLIGVRIQTHRKSSKYNQSMDPIPPLIGYTTIDTVIQGKMIVLELDPPAKLGDTTISRIPSYLSFACKGFYT